VSVLRGCRRTTDAPCGVSKVAIAAMHGGRRCASGDPRNVRMISLIITALGLVLHHPTLNLPRDTHTARNLHCRTNNPCLLKNWIFRWALYVGSILHSRSISFTSTGHASYTIPLGSWRFNLCSFYLLSRQHEIWRSLEGVRLCKGALASITTAFSAGDDFASLGR
jgi:hypothetical protein